ncbi:MAG: type II toxin-antitoxin system RelE/ParE family toxin [Bacteroidota bacterium]
MAHRTIVWTRTAIKQFEKALNFIALDSVVNADKIAVAILKELNKASANAEFFPPDKYKKNNDSSYRAFEKHHYRVIYRVRNNVIRILSIRHTKMNPREY